MKKWNIKAKGNSQEILQKLDSAIESAGGFVFNVDHGNNDSVRFDFRKRVMYPDQILHRNRIIVNGKILNTEAENETDVEITFSQHLIMTLTVFSIIVSWIIAIVLISKMSNSTYMYILGGIVFLAGIALWIAGQNKFKKDIQNHKTFISRILLS